MAFYSEHGARRVGEEPPGRRNPPSERMPPTVADAWMVGFGPRGPAPTLQRDTGFRMRRALVGWLWPALEEALARIEELEECAEQFRLLIWTVLKTAEQLRLNPV